MLGQARCCGVVTGRLSPGRERGARKIKAKWHQLSRSSSSLTRLKPSCSLQAKASAKAQHSLRNHSRFCGLLLLLAWARSRGGRNPHTAKASLPGHLLCESTAFVGKSEWGLRMLLLLA